MKKLFLKTIIIFCVSNCLAQDIQLTQGFANATYMNPAFAGSNACSKFSLVHRTQWIGVSRAYRTYLGSFDHSFTNKNFGIGLIFGSDESGTGNLKNTFISNAFSYEAIISRTSSLRFAIQPGLVTKSISFNKLFFGDQIVRGGNVATIESTPLRRNYFDIGAGALYTNNNYWLGVSFAHLNRANESFYEAVSENLPLKYSLQTGARFLLNKDEKNEAKQASISPVLIYKGQREFDQVDLGFYYNYNVLSLGLWYRGIPVLKAYKKGYPNNDALAFICGINLGTYKIGYSYDLTISQLTSKTMGSHEITMSYQFCKARKKKDKKATGAVYCPKF